MKNFLVPIYIVLFLLSATAFWYFGHHRPAQQILNAEPKHVYISVPIIPKIKTEESNAHLHSHTHDHKTEDSQTQTEDFQTQTTTPLLITQKTSTDQIDTTNNETIVESQTAMEINDDTHHEHHSRSKEEIEAERARRKAFRESAQEYLERAEVEKLRMANEMADFLNTLSIEEQHAYFKMSEEIVYNDIPRLFPGEDTPEDLDRLWNSVLSSLIAIGYTPPEGVNLR